METNYSPFTIHYSRPTIHDQIMSEKLTLLERVKVEGDALRGTIVESLQDELTGSMREEDTMLMKFHGMYQQDDRDRREERAQKKAWKRACANDMVKPNLS